MLFSRMLLVGLTGGLATGKSTVARQFRDCGATLIDADLLARQVVQPGKQAWRDIVRTFGKQVLRPDRTLDRVALAGIVFGDRTKLNKLNAIVHPRVAREQARLAREIARKDPRAVVIYDVPLLFEAGVDNRVDKVIVVTAPPKTQIARLQKRDGLTRTEARRRLRAQMPLAKKVRLANYVVHGTLTGARLRREVRRLYEELLRLT